MHILVFIPFFFEGGWGGGGEEEEGYISMKKSPGFEIGKLGSYAHARKASYARENSRVNYPTTH